jgi:hypothetical protein
MRSALHGSLRFWLFIARKKISILKTTIWKIKFSPKKYQPTLPETPAHLSWVAQGAE